MRIALAAVMAATLGCSNPTYRYRDLAALDDGSALVVWDLDTGGSRVGRVGVDGLAMWESSTTSKPAYAIVGTSLAVSNGVVGIREYREQRARLAIEAIDLETGSHRWDLVLADIEGDANGFSLQTNTSIFEVFDDKVVAIESATGTELVRSTVGHPYDAHVVNQTIVVDALSVVHSMDTHQVSSAEQFGRSCSLHGDLVGFRRKHRQLFIAPVGDLSHARGLELDLDLDAGFTFEFCFVHRERFALVFSSYERKQTSIVFVDEAGHETARISVDGRVSLRGSAPREAIGRFMPLLTALDDEHRHRLSMLDLDLFTAVWTHDLEAAMTTFSHDHRWYVVSERPNAPVILSLDADTGDLRGAVRVRADTATIRREHVRGGSFWIMAYDEWVPTPRLTRLDAKTLVVTLASSHLPVEDIAGSFLDGIAR